MGCRWRSSLLLRVVSGPRAAPGRKANRVTRTRAAAWKIVFIEIVSFVFSLPNTVRTFFPVDFFRHNFSKGGGKVKKKIRIHLTYGKY